MQAVIDACERGQLAARVALIISNNSNSGALRRAQEHGIPGLHLSRKTQGDDDGVDRAMLTTLASAKVDLVVLAGYMRPVGPKVLEHFKGRIINCHPARLPKYGGQGYYGSRVHQAVLAAGEKETGSTIHQVTEIYDQGTIIRQSLVPVLDGDTVASLEARVKAAERPLLIKAIQDVLGSILPGSQDYSPW